MTKILRLSENLKHQAIYMLTIPAFFIGFCMLYNPFDLKDFLDMGRMGYGFHVLMITCIILVTLVLTRATFFFIIKVFDVRWWQYPLWCLGEGFVASCFAALYIDLFKGGDYFLVLSDTMKLIYLTVMWPYLILALFHVIDNKDDEIREITAHEDKSLVRFHDEHKRLKLSVAPSSLLYVRSEANYLRVYYLESDRVREYLLRASMKSIEGARGLVRCHRSYFVNPEHVKVLRKDADGLIYAELNLHDVPAVPVSKQYYQSLSSLL